MKIRLKLPLITVIIICVQSAAFIVFQTVFLRNQTVEEVSRLTSREITRIRNRLRERIGTAVKLIETLPERHGTVPAQEVALRLLETISFDNGTGYFWITDTRYPFPTMLLNSAAPELAGSTLDRPEFNCAGPANENLFTAALNTVADSGSGFIRYRWAKPLVAAPDSLFPKMSFVKKVDRFNWVIGTGAYLDDVERTVTARSEALHRQQRDIVRTLSGITVLLLLVSTIFISVSARAFLRPVQNLTNITGRISQDDANLATRIEVRGNDEIGLLGRNFNRMTEKLEATLGSLRESREKLTRQVRRETLLHQTAHAAVGQKAAHPFLTAVAPAIIEALDISGLFYFRFDPPTDQYLPVFLHTRSDSSVNPEKITPFLATSLPWLEANRHTSRLFLFDNLTAVDSAPEKAMVLRLGIRSLALYPLNIAECHFGFFGCSESRRERAWDHNDKKTLEAVGDLLLQVIEIERYEESLARSNRQLRQADKLASLGVLSSGMAHEINNPNNLIMFNADIALDTWKGVVPYLDAHFASDTAATINNHSYSEIREQFPQFLENIAFGSQRIQKIVHSLKEFCRVDTGMYNQVINIHHVVESAILIVSHLIEKSTRRFDRSFSSKTPFIQGNYQQLEQVVVNLLTNACQSLTDAQQRVSVATG